MLLNATTIAQMLHLDSDIIVAVVTSGVTLLGVIINSHTLHKNTLEKTEQMNERTIAEVQYRIGSLEKEVQKHNNVIERVYELEKDDKLHEEQIKVANHRIEDLEKERG